MRIAMGHVDEYDDAVAAFARQLGLSSVQLHCPRNLPAEDGYWTARDLSALRQRCSADGLRLEGLENVPLEHFIKIQRGEPGRDQQIDNFLLTIRNMARADIRLLGYNFMATYVWRTATGGAGRGGARVSRFSLSEVSAGNALAQYKLTPPDVSEPIDADTMWANHEYFLDAVLPVAEEVGVRLALHPDDPPVDVALGRAARIFTSPAALERASYQAKNSPNWGLNLCLGTVSEMGGQGAITNVIDTFGPHGKIYYAHFRDVRGYGESFDECFLGEGNFDPATIIRHLDAVAFEGFLIDDHVPALIGDVDTWANTSSDAYCSRGRAHAIGYLQGLIAGVGGTAPVFPATTVKES